MTGEGIMIITEEGDKAGAGSLEPGAGSQEPMVGRTEF